jgi:hypothetical protein
MQKDKYDRLLEANRQTLDENDKFEFKCNMICAEFDNLSQKYNRLQMDIDEMALMNTDEYVFLYLK